MKKSVIVLFLLSFMGLFSCSCEEGSSSKNSEAKEMNAREYNQSVKEEQASNRTPCDTLALQEYILNNYEEGTFLVDFDKTYIFTVPKPAVIYYKRKNKNYIFAAIAKSKEGERNIETDNIVGYESSFINLDSTKLGTAFFYLTLFECDGEGNFSKLWESEIPIHGGFSSMKLKKWKAKKQLYIELFFDAGIISGNRKYNYFLTDGIEKEPHLMETYEGIAHKRTILNYNNDKYPDYTEYLFVDSVDYNAIVDSIPFYWDTTKTLYVTKQSRRWKRKY